MLVMYDAQVFPRFFATNKDLGLAYGPLLLGLLAMLVKVAY